MVGWDPGTVQVWAARSEESTSVARSTKAPALGNPNGPLLVLFVIAPAGFAEEATRRRVTLLRP